MERDIEQEALEIFWREWRKPETTGEDCVRAVVAYVCGQREPLTDAQWATIIERSCGQWFPLTRNELDAVLAWRPDAQKEQR